VTGRPLLDRPVFIVAAPRSGSTLLFEAMARGSDLWTLGGEAHAELEGIPEWHPRSRAYESNRLAAEDARPRHRRTLLDAFARRLRDREGVRWQSLAPGARRARVRFLEKTPKNALRIPLLKALFPDARFVFLSREPRGNVSSIMEAWRSGRFVTYRKLPGWSGPPWSLLLPPGWRELDGAPLERVAAFQWRVTNEIASDDLASLPDADWCAVTYEDLLADPGATLRRLYDFIEAPHGSGPKAMAGAELPHSRHTLTPPDPGKWRRNRRAIEAVLPGLEATWRRLRALAAPITAGG
jgi:hypothetical protein